MANRRVEVKTPIGSVTIEFKDDGQVMIRRASGSTRVDEMGWLVLELLDQVAALSAKVEALEFVRPLELQEPDDHVEPLSWSMEALKPDIVDEDEPTLLTKDVEDKPKVNINTAKKTALVSLAGIGESTAQKIVDLRQESPFGDMDDLTRRAGLTPRIAKMIARLITF